MEEDARLTVKHTNVLQCATGLTGRVWHTQAQRRFASDLVSWGYLWRVDGMHCKLTEKGFKFLGREAPSLV